MATRTCMLGLLYAVARALALFRGDTATVDDAASPHLDTAGLLAALIGERAESVSGVVAYGRDVAVADLDVAPLAREWGATGGVRHFVKVEATGPGPVRILVPAPEARCELAVYRRVDRGLYMRASQEPRRLGAYRAFQADYPGEYIVREEEDPAPAAALKMGVFDFTPTTSDPEARTHWGLSRVRPLEIAGIVPLILVHGLSNDRWGEFIEWAATSPEAEPFREQFQVWDFCHDARGVDAAIGFSPDFPAFEASIAASLNRYINEAQEHGVEGNGAVHFFPEGPFAMLTHSTGGLKARAFLRNFPEQADRVLAVVTIAAPHAGTPLATPEWLRHTMTRLGSSDLPVVNLLLQSALGDLFTTAYMRVDRQSDLDAGWGDFDARGGFGIPTATFRIWRHGPYRVTLSPRDANQTEARWLPGFDDATFDPPELRATFCGGLDEIMPSARGEDHLDKFFVYASYLKRPNDWLGMVRGAEKACQEPAPASLSGKLFENAGLRLANVLLSVTASAGSDAPLGVYAVNDGFIPLQSALLLDGAETDLIYETCERDGYRYPVIPYRPREDLILEHTLFNPDRVRILPGWSHLDTVTGRYNPRTGHSTLFSMVAEDLLSAVP